MIHNKYGVPMSRKAMMALNPGGLVEEEEVLETVGPRPSGRNARNWDLKYGQTHNPDGTLIATPNTCLLYTSPSPRDS